MGSSDIHSHMHLPPSLPSALSPTLGTSQRFDTGNDLQRACLKSELRDEASQEELSTALELNNSASMSARLSSSCAQPSPLALAP
eukprot:SM000024S07749  [mRNA]  locus=s24:248214:249195:+ [translate_table: standard]